MGKKNNSKLNWPGLSPSYSLCYLDSADKSVKGPSTWEKHLKWFYFFFKFRLPVLSLHLSTSFFFFPPETICTSMSKILYMKVPLSKLEIILYRYKVPKVWKILWIYIFNLLRASFKWYKVSTNSILHQKFFKSKIQAKTSTFIP